MVEIPYLNRKKQGVSQKNADENVVNVAKYINLKRKVDNTCLTKNINETQIKNTGATTT